MKKNKSTKKNPKLISAEEFDKRFDEGESIMEYADPHSFVMAFRINVDFPAWVVKKLDQEATRQGISRQALIKVWITEKVDALPDRGVKKTG